MLLRPMSAKQLITQMEGASIMARVMIEVKMKVKIRLAELGLVAHNLLRVSNT